MAIDKEHSEFAEAALSIEAFERLVDAFGSDSSRWPVGRRGAADVLLRRGGAESCRAQEIIAQAKALERVINEPRRVDASRMSSLADRIVAAASEETSAIPVVRQATQHEVFDLSAARQKRVVAKQAPLGRNGWAAALLAASLLLGVFVGSGMDPVPALQAAADAVGLGPYVDQLALGAADDTGQLQDEDVL